MTGNRVDAERLSVREALQNAIQSVDHARAALAKKEPRGFADHVWKAAFYLEYVTFLLSLSRTQSDETWKQRVKRERAVDVAATLSSVQDVLADAAADDSVDGVYRKAWMARGQLLRVQRRLDRTQAEPFLT